MKASFKDDYIIETTLDHSPMRKNTFSKTRVEELTGRDLDKAEREKSKSLPMGRRAKLSYQERRRKVTREYKKLFSKGDSFVVKDGVNVLVGDNGCGKSSLIRILMDQNPDSSIVSVDMETSNPKINAQRNTPSSPLEISNMFMWSSESHGETREGVLLSILRSDFGGVECLILDEPEQGLSLKNQHKYYDLISKVCNKVIIITHSETIIKRSDQVFDVESMSWVESSKYLSSCHG